MQAMIDVYHEEISCAIERGDQTKIAEIAKAFCERCHYYKPWKIVGVRAHVCPIYGLQAHIDIKFDDESTAQVIAGYQRGKRRLTVNGKHISCESSADVVHDLQTPCAFFDGIYYAVEGLEAIARGELAQQVAKWDTDAKKAKQQCDIQMDWLMQIGHSVNAGIKKLEKLKGQICRAIEVRRLIGTKRSWTIHPEDFDSRLVEAASMLRAPCSDFISLREARHKLRGKSGVYFGWRVTDGKLVYVGKSKNLGSRLNLGRDELLDCKISWIEMPEKHIHTWELFYIWLHQPERNGQIVEAIRCDKTLTEQESAA